MKVIIQKNIVFRFPDFLLDETQNKNDVQMQILELLNQNGLKDIILAGDPDQADDLKGVFSGFEDQ